MTTITRQEFDQYIANGWTVTSSTTQGDRQTVELTRTTMSIAGIFKRVASVPVGLVTVPLGFAGSVAGFFLSGLVCCPLE